jgi:regulator of protease activity HflC (stomatin/prohibitin superfamily)
MGQETLTSDQISIRVSMVLFYRITNPEVAARSVQNYQEHLHLAIQAGIRLAVSSKKLDELLADRDSLAATISTSVKEEAGRIGLEMLRLSTKDLMISGELKQAYADGLKARLEGQAILEKARGETAAIRSLLNATQLMESNPGLYQLRYLQTIDRALAEGKGHTIMLGVAETLKNHLPAREGK